MSCRICYIVVIYLQLDLDIIKLYSICTTCQLPTHNGHYVIIFTFLIITNKYAVKLYYKDKQHMRLTRVLPHILVGFVLLNLQFYMYVLQIVVCPFVLFLLAIVLSVLRYTDSDYSFGIFKTLLLRHIYLTLLKKYAPLPTQQGTKAGYGRQGCIFFLVKLYVYVLNHIGVHIFVNTVKYISLIDKPL